MSDIEYEYEDGCDELLDITSEYTDHPPSTVRKKNKKSLSEESLKLNAKNTIRDNCSTKARQLIAHAKKEFKGHTPVPETLFGAVFTNIRQQCEHDPNLSTVIAQVDRINSKILENIRRNQTQINVASAQSAETMVFIKSIETKSYEDLVIVQSQVELMLKAVKLFKLKNSSDQIANEYVMWAITKIANDKATPEARQFTTGAK